MGNYAIISSKNIHGIKKAADHFRRLLHKDSIQINIGNYVFLYCDKSMLEDSLFLKKDDGFIAFSGSPVFPGKKTLQEGMEDAWQKITLGKTDELVVRGIFSYVYFNIEGKLKIGHDGVSVANLYCNSNNSVISTSFIITAIATETNLHYNQFALSELCLLGHITGDDTFFTEIRKIHHHHPDANFPFSWASKPVKFSENDFVSHRSFSDEVDHQLEVLENFFKDSEPMMNHYGVSLGISDGHDSRLLAGFLVRYIHALNLYSFWRKIETFEISIGKQICEKLKLPLQFIEGRDYADKSEQEIEDTFRSAFYFFDGQPRLHCNFFDDFNTPEFISVLTREKKVSINGVGGEAYRNNMHFLFKNINTTRFFKTHILDNGAPCALNNDQKSLIAEYLKKKFNSQLVQIGLPVIKGRYNRIQIQYFLNEFHPNGFRMNRTNGENQFVLQIPPYMDTQVVHSSYQAMNHLGISYSFQQAMLRKNHAELAEVISGYGYSFSKGEPISDKIKYIIKALVPDSLQLRRRMQITRDGNAEKVRERFKCMKQYSETVRQLHLPFNFEIINSQSDRWPVICSLGFTLAEINRLRE